MSTEFDVRRRGDRHLRPNPNLATLFDPTGTVGRRVRLRASRTVAMTPGGQHTLWLLTNLLARQFGVVLALDFVLPDVPLLPGVAAFGEASTLAETLLQTAHLVTGGQLPVTIADVPTGEADIEVSVGRDDLGAARFHVAVLGSGWRVAAGAPEDMPADAPEGGNSFGPYFAACLGAGEVFKRLQGMQEGKGRFATAFYLSLWDGEVRGTWEALPAGAWEPGLELPAAYLIGGGAVGQAAAAVLRATGLKGHLTVCEGETIDDDGTNLNRYVLATDSDRGVGKAPLLAARLEGSRIQVHPHSRHWPDYAIEQPHAGQRPDLRAREADYRYGVVLSCVDKNPARHSIQNYWPELILGGSTLDLGLEINAYDMSGPFECLKCNNRVEPGRTQEDVAAELRQLAPEERRARALALGVNAADLEAYLEDPKCGTLGAGAIAKFASESEVSWSVGFVSAGAGILLAAQLVLRELRAPGTLPLVDGHMRRFSFLNLRVQLDGYHRETTCDCSTAGRDEFERLWGSSAIARAGGQP